MATMVDPVCGMKVQEESLCSDYHGEHYCFCSEECRQNFERHPEKFVRKAS